MTEIYLVTGGTGYVGSFVVLQLLEAGKTVKTTIRNLAKEAQFRKSLVDSSEKLTTKDVETQLTVYKADLLSDDGWEEAFKDVTYVLHVASPFPSSVPSDPQVLIKPAKEGTLRILKWAKATPTVKHVVITSSFAAIGFGFPDDRTTPYSEKDWTVVENVQHSPYVVSKTLAEQSAWYFAKNEDVKYGLSVINPALIIGPSLKGQVTDSTSLFRIKSLVDGSLKDGVAPSSTHLVDVRDIAKLHIEALTNPKANGERFLAHSGPNLSFLEAGEILRKSNIPESLKKNIPTKELEGAKQSAKPCDISKAKAAFDWTPIPNEVSLVATVEGLIADGQLKV
ncbi:Coumarine and phenylpropanoid biosynthesis [Scheffersomyces amazonensis]|uniref:Coumarine and phenylpropanoid biosynthesis n=1 Tax=Scheffersomyces amazonensis TaxID=1078765 RepID=UPI00315D48CC